MCGIAGFLGNTSHPLSALERMTRTIIHRGPDSEGHWDDESCGIALGHRRLAIVDLSPAGNQPMHSESGRFIIAFNGEIYNHLDLRAALQAQGYSNAWRGHSDTETLLAGFDVWGIRQTIECTVGMFAFAVWDRQERTLTLGRDRLGEKPLYYGWQGSGAAAVFLFGSELKALRAHPSFQAGISRDSLALFMRYGNVPGSYSIYEGVHKLTPGSLMTISLSTRESKLETYWSGIEVVNNGVSHPFAGSEDDAIEALDDLLKKAVSQQMVADVPLGAFLSGGVDSSTVVSLMQAQSARPVKTFSIGFNEAAYNEAVYAKDVAAHLGTAHTEFYVSPEDAIGVIPKLPELYDEPFADASQIPTFLVSQMASEHVTVSLSGDAGDELFAGYNRYHLAANTWQRLERLPRSLRKLTALGIAGVSPDAWDRLAALMPLGQRWTNVGPKLHKGARVLGARDAADLYLGLVSHWQDPAGLVLGSKEPSTLLTSHQLEFAGLSNIERMMALDMLTYLPDDILTKVDRAAMGVSLETRVPFLDHRVVEFAWKLPMAYKLRPESYGFRSKWILRQVLDRYVPQHLIDRPKMGFGIPLHEWLRGPLRQWAEALLNESRLKREGYFRVEIIGQKWAEHLSGKYNWFEMLWCVLMFQAWLEKEQAA